MNTQRKRRLEGLRHFYSRHARILRKNGLKDLAIKADQQAGKVRNLITNEVIK